MERVDKAAKMGNRVGKHRNALRRRRVTMGHQERGGPDQVRLGRRPEPLMGAPLQPLCGAQLRGRGQRCLRWKCGKSLTGAQRTERHSADSVGRARWTSGAKDRETQGVAPRRAGWAALVPPRGPRKWGLGGEEVRRGETGFLVWAGGSDAAPEVRQFLQKPNDSPLWPSPLIELLGIHPRDTRTSMHTQTCARCS